MFRRWSWIIPLVGMATPMVAHPQSGLQGANVPATMRKSEGHLPHQSDPFAQLVSEAWNTNLGIKRELQSVRRAAAEKREAEGRFLPSLDLEARVSRFDGVPNIGDFVNPAYAALNELTGSTQFPTNIDVTLPQRAETRLRLTQPLVNLQIIGAYQLSDARYDGQKAQFNASARALAAQVQFAWLGAASASRITETLKSALLLVKENERVYARLVEAGRSTPEALHRARAELSDVTQQLAESEERALAATRTLNTMLRRSFDLPLDRVDEQLLLRPIPFSADSAAMLALFNRAELVQADAGIRTAKAAHQIAGSAFFPSLALAVDYGFQGRELTFGRRNDVATASLIASWNLFRGGSDAARRRAAAADLENTRMERDEIADKIALDARTAHEAARVAWSALATADERLASARRTYELVRRRAEEGVAPLIEVIDARNALTGAELNKVFTVYRYASRWVDLERATALRQVPVYDQY